jgi:acyl-CoA thioester hydrolase
MDAPFETTVDVRVRDIDTMGHVNNAVYATFLEQARSAYFRKVLGERLDLVDTVLVSLEIGYCHEISLGDDVTITLEIPELGTSSVPMEYTIRTQDTVAATAETTQVLVDPENGSSRPLPDSWRREIKSFEGW